MRWLVLLILALGMLMPSGTWAQGTTVAPYTPVKRSIAQAVANSLHQQMIRRDIETELAKTTWQRVQEAFALPANQLDSWMRLAQALGLPVGTKYSSGSDGAYCAAHPSDGACANYTGGGGSEAGWEPDCDGNYQLDASGNVILPAMKLPDPIKYVYGQFLWTADTTSDTVTNEPWSAIKVGMHLSNNPLAENLRLAPMYATQWEQGSTRIYGVVTSRLAYYNGATKVNSGFGTKSVGGSSTYRWQTTSQYGTPPPPDYICEDGIGMGYMNQHYKACIKPPAHWAIPTMGVVAPASLNSALTKSV